MKHFLIFIIVFAYLAFLSCSNDVAGGGDDFPNSMVVGMIVDADGNGAGNVEVTLIPYNFNPYTDSLDRTYKDTTDSLGNYSLEIDVNSIYTIFASDKKSGKKVLRFEFPVFLPENDAKADTLRPTGSVECLFPDSITDEGYVYISGSPYYRDLSDGEMRIDGKFSVMLDSLPETEVPAVLMRTTKKSIIGSFVDIVPTDTIPIGDTVTLPLWEFKVLIGVSQETSQYFGSLDSVISKIQKQLRSVMNKYNYPKVFDGVFNFVIDSVYKYSLDDSTEYASDWSTSGADYRFLYSALSPYVKSTWNYTNQTVFITSSTSDSIFSSNTNDAIVWLLGLARGAFPYDWMTVDGSLNPVNGQSYLGIKSIMNMPYGETVWDEHHIDILNFNGGGYYAKSAWETKLQPDSIIIKTVNDIGDPLEGATINIHQVPGRTDSVESNITITGTTNSSGEFLLSANPYDFDDDGILAALNCLVISIYESDTSYCWIPITEAASSYIRNKPYKVVITH